MSIREKGYHHWDGELQAVRFRWKPIFVTGIKNVIKKKYVKSILMFTIIPFFVFLIGLYVSTKPELKMLKDIVRLLDSDARFFQEFAMNGYIFFMLFIMGIFFGAELISGDIKFNSFPLYFSRPLDRKDYISGKFSIIMFYFLAVTLVPNLLLLLFKIIFTGKFGIPPQVFLALLLAPLLTSFLIASITLMVSSMSSNIRYVKIIIFLIYFFSQMISQILYEIFRNPYFHLLSISKNLKLLGAFLFNTTPSGRLQLVPSWLSLLVVLAISAGAFFLLNKRIRKAEAQIDSGN